MANYSGTRGAEKLADRLAKLNPQALEGILAKMAQLGKAMVVDKITDDVRPHSGLSRSRNPQQIVTNLVDTGAYRQSWQVKQDSNYRFKVSTNIEYAAPLEYGTEDMPGFFVARDVARKSQVRFKELANDAIRETLNK